MILRAQWQNCPPLISPLQPSVPRCRLDPVVSPDATACRPGPSACVAQSPPGELILSHTAGPLWVLSKAQGQISSENREGSGNQLAVPSRGRWSEAWRVGGPDGGGARAGVGKGSGPDSHALWRLALKQRALRASSGRGPLEGPECPRTPQGSRAPPRWEGRRPAPTGLQPRPAASRSRSGPRRGAEAGVIQLLSDPQSSKPVVEKPHPA